MPKISYRLEDIAFHHIFLVDGKTVHGGPFSDGKKPGPLEISVEQLAEARERLRPFTYRTWKGAEGATFADIFRDATPKYGCKDVPLLSLLTVTDEPPPPPPPVAIAATSPEPEQPEQTVTVTVTDASTAAPTS